MKKELQEKLYNKYPLIFQQKDLSMKETCMCWGISCFDGWYWIINRLCNSIQSYIDQNDHLKIEQVQATQVKEKFGRLCFYYRGGDGDIRGMVSLAELMSYHICEECGFTENVGHTKGWIYTLCEKCSLTDERYKDWSLDIEKPIIKIDINNN